MPKSRLFIVPRERPWREQVPNNLPIPTSRLLGREDDVAALCRLLEDPAVRLLTLTGPGGVGKTRLALEVAEMMLEEFVHGVYFVDLAVVTDPDMLVPAIAGSLRLEEKPGEPLVETVGKHLQDKKVLLVLDNFEQIAQASSSLPELLASCPDLKLIITSRATLGLRAGREVAVSPLQLPAPGQHLGVNDLEQYGAVALFMQRANDIDAGFELTGDNAGAVVEICRRVDGLPLAIELVTAYLGLLSPRSILARLTHPLQILTAGPVQLPDRHRTMRDTIAWSYSLLNEPEQRLFRRLSVFVGSFSQRGAEAVCNDVGDTAIAPDDPGAIEVLEGMRSLVSKSLVRRIKQDGDDDPRLGMLETVREYAWEQLAASGDVDALRQRHADYYMALAERVGPETKGQEQTTSLATLLAEQDNLRAALQWLLERSEPAGSDDALRLIQALHIFWEHHMHVSEFRGWLDRALAQAGPGATPLLAWSLQRAASLARWQGDFQKATVLAEESLAMAHEVGDDFAIATALNALGGIALYQGDYETAGVRSSEALVKYRELGMDKEIAVTLGNLGLVALYGGDFARAEELYKGCVQWLRESGYESRALVAMTNLGYAAHYQGDSTRAREIFLETLELTIKVDNQLSGARLLAGLAGTVLVSAGPQDLQSVTRVAQLLGLSAARLEHGGGKFDPRAQTEFERNVAAAHERLGERAFNKAWEEGATLDLEQALELASTGPKQDDRTRSATQVGRGTTRPREVGGLTAREYEIAALAAQGLTNRAIAERLILSKRTVEMHIAHTLDKLGLSSRTELAAWAIRNGVAPDTPPN